MRADSVTLITLGLICGAKAAPTYSCFDPPNAVDQANPLGEGMEDVVEDECCEALVDESDIVAGRFVVYDPENCNFGSEEEPVASEPLCFAHDADGCRFCRETCDDFEGLCLVCSEIADVSFTTGAPTPSPFDFTSGSDDTPAPVTLAATTPAPFGIFPATPAPTAAAPAPETPAPVVEASPETPAPVTETTTTPAPITEATPETPAPVVPETPAPIVPETPAPITETTPDTPAPITATTPETPAPVTETTPETPAPITEAAPETPAPITEAAPETPAPVEPEAPTPVVPVTPAPITDTEGETPAPVMEAPVETPSPVSGSEECDCQMSETEIEVMETRGKRMVCDETCSDGTDLIWGVMNCNYFALGQNCRACSDFCEDNGDGTWLDPDDAFCKPCDEIES